MEADGKFYFGRVFDLARSQVTDQPLLYNPADLTTHAVVVGMTGSGKTGLCIDLLEEAALAGIPALMIDPKGDITNTLLHFPDLLPEDFQPWLDPDLARRSGKSLEQAASDTAAAWREGLSNWDIQPERVRNLQEAACFAVYTPGSDAGIPVSILASLKAPQVPWESNRELLREKISGTVTALLSLVGLENIDPVRTREHILLSNIFEHAWSAGKDLDLAGLILQTQTPPFSSLGVFDVNTFFPQKDRFELAMLLNNILAAPAFQSWIEGQPLDIPSLLYAPDGRPRHCVFYIAHLTDSERMFFVTLLYSAVQAWMRTQAGSSSLKALMYFDEIFGYLPPTSNPPSKQLMLSMLKQARAFGVGQVLVTQNPVDLDYKALSNAGSWFIGKLQTDRDKQRLLDGLEGAMAGSLDRSQYDRMISQLGKRVFLLHNINSPGPNLFQTRWAMNYLAGPLTRTQIPALNQLAGADEPGAGAPTPRIAQPEPVSSAQTPAPSDTQPVLVSSAVATEAAYQSSTPKRLAPTFSSTRPALAASVAEYFLPNNQGLTEAFQAAGQPNPQDAISQGLVYRPMILAQASIRFFNRKYNLDHVQIRTGLVSEVEKPGVVHWETYQVSPVETQALDHQPDPEAHFATPDATLLDAKTLNSLQKDFLEWAFRSSQVMVRANEALGIYAGPEVSQAEFRTHCADAARQARDAEAEKTADAYEKKLAVLQDKLDRAQIKQAASQEELSDRKKEEFGANVEDVLGLFGKKRGKRRLTSLSKHRLVDQAKVQANQASDLVENLKQQIADVQQEQAQAVDEISRRWGEAANQVTEIPVFPFKKDVSLDLFGVAWTPFHEVKIGDDSVELPGYKV
jgi:hypothetical protein